MLIVDDLLLVHLLPVGAVHEAEGDADLVDAPLPELVPGQREAGCHQLVPRAVHPIEDTRYVALSLSHGERTLGLFVSAESAHPRA